LFECRSMPQYLISASFGLKWVRTLTLTPPLNRGVEADYMIIIQGRQQHFRLAASGGCVRPFVERDTLRRDVIDVVEPLLVFSIPINTREK
jgi:hypothetical protein